jgi:hypothetical protein
MSPSPPASPSPAPPPAARVPSGIAPPLAALGRADAAAAVTAAARRRRRRRRRHPLRQPQGSPRGELTYPCNYCRRWCRRLRHRRPRRRRCACCSRPQSFGTPSTQLRRRSWHEGAGIRFSLKACVAHGYVSQCLLSSSTHFLNSPPFFQLSLKSLAIMILHCLFGVFRTVDLGQQYDKVSRVGGNFSFDIDTFVIIIIRCITLGVVCSSIFPSRLNLVYSTPWNSHVCGPAPNSTSGSSLRGVVTRFFVYTRLIATAFWGA